MAFGGSLEITSRGPEPGRNGARIDPERVGNLRRRELFELGEHEDLALVVVELFEKALDQASRFGFGERLVRAEVARIGERFGIGVGQVDMGALAAGSSTVLADHAHEDCEDPGLDRASSSRKVIEAEFGEASVGDQEDMLNNIVDCGIVHPESSRSAPDEFHVCVVKFSKS